MLFLQIFNILSSGKKYEIKTQQKILRIKKHCHIIILDSTYKYCIMISFIISRRYVVKNIRSLVGVGVSPLVASKKMWYDIVNL